MRIYEIFRCGKIISEIFVIRSPYFHLGAIVDENFPDEVLENIFTISFALSG